MPNLGVDTNLNVKSPIPDSPSKIIEAAVGNIGSSLNAKQQTSIPRKTQEIDPTRWNEVHTYSFVIAEASEEDGSLFIGVRNGVFQSGLPVSSGKFKQLVDTKIDLNLNPQSLAVQTIFANNVTATNKGVLEENNGVVFRNITISGTTGVLPQRETADNSGPLAGTFVSKIFPAATQAIGGLAKLTSSLLGSSTQSSFDSSLQKTGYYQFWTLHNFFVAYAEVKKLPEAKNLRLIFSCPKDNIGYICTPIAFELRKDKDAPLQYRYAIQLKCWDIESTVPSSKPGFDTAGLSGPGFIKGVLNKLRQARKTILASSNVIRGFQSDVNDALQGVNQSILAIKDAVGVGADVIDVLPTIKNNAILMANSTSSQLESAFAAVGVDVRIDRLSSDNQSSKTTSPTGESRDISQPNSVSARGLTSALNNVDAIDQVSLDSLGTLPAAVQSQIDVQLAKAQDITTGDVQSLAVKMQEISDNLAYNAGMMDAQYAKTYRLPPPGTSDRSPTEDDILLAVQLQEAKNAYYESLASRDLFQEKEPDLFAAANFFLETADPVSTPNSQFPVFVERGASLERIAQTYLGDPNRAREIAILNNLRAPYIDESGFDLPATLASGRTFLVQDRSRLIINQKVVISGTGQAPTTRNILDIEDIGGGNFRVSVDGNPDLSRFIPTSSPSIHARLPGTIGSGDTILIPSSSSPDGSQVDRPTNLLSTLTHAERVFKVDLQITDKGDLNVSPSGDVAASFGYLNAIQALRLLLETERGELEQHLTYGIPTQVGERVTGLTVTQAAGMIKAAVLADSRYSNATVSVIPNGSVFNIRVEVVGTEGTGRIPVEFQVNAA